MTERDEVVTRLRASGVLPAIRWAYLSAAAQTLNDYSEDAGYDASGSGVPGIRCFVTTWTGFSPAGATPLRRGNTAYLTAHDIETKPEVPHTLVQRADLNRSHGWVIENIRFLLASPPYGEIEQLPWPQKSSTKHRCRSRASRAQNHCRLCLTNSPLARLVDWLPRRRSLSSQTRMSSRTPSTRSEAIPDSYSEGHGLTRGAGTPGTGMSTF